MTNPDAFWLEHCPRPRERPPSLAWDVFISYRSVDRIWALSLYDMLQQAGWTTFLDQFVLPAGSGLQSQLSENLARSASGVLLWSSRTHDSKWVEREIGAMLNRVDKTAASAVPFLFVPAKLDASELPALLEQQLYVDFSAYPDGPTGAELIRLLCGLKGAAPAEGAVKRIAAYEESFREEPNELRAMKAAGVYEAILERARAGGPAYTTSATLAALAAQYLIDGKRYDDALAVIDEARKRFKRSIRLRQLRGLALRRLGRLPEALLELERLRADGNQDPETLGILAATLTASSEAGGGREDLERARDLYAVAFELTPTDTYVGINAATKSAMLGEIDRAQEIAGRVLKALEDDRANRDDPSKDYWVRVTEPEALLILGRYEEALREYHAARIAHSKERGSIESTAAQVRRLIAALPVPEPWAGKLRDEFAGFGTDR